MDIGEGMPTDPKVSVGVDGEDNRIYIEKSGADLEASGLRISTSTTDP
ncbi:MAG: hypothetical protein R3E53_14565 [Myxococcota bacterium]